MFFLVLWIIQLLDFLLGHRRAALFRRAELKTLVDFHGNEVCNLIPSSRWSSLLCIPCMSYCSFLSGWKGRRADSWRNHNHCRSSWTLWENGQGCNDTNLWYICDWYQCQTRQVLFCDPSEKVSVLLILRFFLWYRDLMNLILEKGHSRVPVYYEQPTNIIGLVLVTFNLMH